MPSPASSGSFPDVLDSRFAKIYDDAYKQLPDRISQIYGTPPPSPLKGSLKLSQVGAFGDTPEFTGTVTYDEIFEGYDVTITDVEYANGFQIRRRLFDEDLYGIMDGKPQGLGSSHARTRQKHAAQTFNNAFGVDTTWQAGGDAVALCSNSHTTRSSASTSTGFDNLATAGFSAVALQAARIGMKGFRDDRGNRLSVMPNKIIHPVDLYADVYEVLQSQGNPADASNAANVNYRAYTSMEWEYLDDANNWFLVDDAMQKQMLFWRDTIPQEFAMAEDLDTLIGKWRLYAKYSLGFRDWRWIYGSQVS